MTTEFDNTAVRFREFSAKNGYPEDVVWVEPRDILLSGRRLLYVKIPVDESNQLRVREKLESGLRSRKGILLETVCATESTTFAFAWTSEDARERELNLSGEGVKMSARVEASRVAAKVVRSGILWKYLKYRFRDHQVHKAELFRLTRGFD